MLLALLRRGLILGIESFITATIASLALRVDHPQHPVTTPMLLSLWVSFLPLVFAQTWYALFPLLSE